MEFSICEILPLTRNLFLEVNQYNFYNILNDFVKNLTLYQNIFKKFKNAGDIQEIYFDQYVVFILLFIIHLL